MKIHTKIWHIQYGCHKIEINHNLLLSLRSSIKIKIDGVQVVGTPPRLEMHRDLIEFSYDSDGRSSKLLLLVSYNRPGLKLIHQLNIDGICVSGEKDFKDFYGAHMPNRNFFRHIANKGIPSGVAYIVLMIFISEGITLERAMGTFLFFSLFMSLVFYGTSRLVHGRSE